ncbi:MAG TPA: hypothetical protein VFQ91_14805 [Bryobacteraceae bacterium]|nr:hypothetical protein [Bryobacteraceae bacterium]
MGGAYDVIDLPLFHNCTTLNVSAAYNTAGMQAVRVACLQLETTNVALWAINGASGACNPLRLQRCLSIAELTFAVNF